MYVCIYLHLQSQFTKPFRQLSPLNLFIYLFIYFNYLFVFISEKMSEGGKVANLERTYTRTEYSTNDSLQNF